MKKWLVWILALFLCGCVPAPEDTGTEPIPGASSGQSQAPFPEDGELFTDRDYRTDYDPDGIIGLEGDTITVSGAGVTVLGTTVTVTRAGTYLLRGELADGQVIVDTDKESKVQLVLENAAIHCQSSAAVYIRQGDKVFLTLAAGTRNTLSSGEVFEPIDESNIDAALFSREDLTVNGEGTLTVLSPGGHGIVSKDGLTLTGGTLILQTAGHGLSGKDNICIDGARLEITAGKDAIQCDHGEDASLGFVHILSGSFRIDAQGDGISASSRLTVLGGEFDILTGGGRENGQAHTSGDWGQMGGGPGGHGGPGGFGGFGGMGGFGGAQTETAEDTVSSKGLKATATVELYGGDFRLDCADDGIHSNGELILWDGNYEIATGDDGLHADGALTVSGGELVITESYEGLEGQSILLSGGRITLSASDDGLNAAGGNDGSGMGGRPGGEMFAADKDCFIQISGGELLVDAQGDGIDSNGDLRFTGGQVTVEGPTGGGNGPLDYAGTGTVAGGVLRISGSVDMAQSLQSDGQGVLGVSVGNMPGGTGWQLLDGKGNVILSGQPEKAYACIVISCPELVSGQTYTLQVGTLTGELRAE